MNNIKRTIGTVALTSLMVALPLAASANTVNATSSTGIVISPSGIVRVIGADVTAVGTNFIDAILNIGNAAISVVLNTSGNTKIVANGSKTATTTDIRVGDNIAFKGTLLSSTGSLLTVAATKVRDTTSFPFPHIAAGTISSVNLTNGSFVVAGKDNTNTTVTTNASTSIMLNGSTSALASLPVNSKVVVIGTHNSDGSIMATKVMVNTNATIGNDNNKNDNENDGDNNATSTSHGNAGGDNNGLHLGLGKLFGGLHFGKND